MYSRYIIVRTVNTEILPQIKDFFFKLLGLGIKIDIEDNNLIIYTNYKSDIEEPLKALTYDSLENMKIYVSSRFDTESVFASNLSIIKSYFLKVNLRESYYEEHKLLMELVMNGYKNNLLELVFKSLSSDTKMIEIVKTFIESNMNTSKACKILYMHRNTLINKLEKFNEVTGYDIKKFTDAFIIYHLVKK